VAKASYETIKMLKTLLTWIYPPFFPVDEDKTRSALLLNVILNTFLVALPILVLAVILGGNIPQTGRVVRIVALAWMTIFGTKLIMFSGRVFLAGIVAVIIIFITTTFVVYNLGTIRAPATSFFLLAIVTAGLTISRRAIVWTAGASSLVIIVLLLAEKNGFLPRPDLTVSITQATTFIIVFAIISFLLFLAVKNIDESLARVRQELAERKQTEAALQHSTDQLEILHEIDRSLLAARSLREIADDALIRIRRLVPCPRASITLFDLTKHEASFLAANADQPFEIPDTPIPWEEFGLDVIDVLRQNKPWFTEDMLAESEVTDLDIRLANEKGIRVWLSLPLLYQGQLIGALNLGRCPGKPFDERDAEIAHDIANQLAIALQQTNLYDELQNELAERKKLISQLEANNAELERFTYTVSHDLRNPLVTIKGFLGMLRKDLGEGKEDHVATDLQRIENAADKMHALLADLLELSRIGRIMNPPQDVDLSRVVHEAIETLDARLRSKNVVVQASLEFPVVYGDRVRLREVFENLIDNAAKYTGDQPNPLIEIGTRNDDGEPVFFVKDNGLGIETRFQQRIFGLFEKLNPTSEGTGVGLALIKRIIEVHGGKIWVESEGMGKGSTFCFTIPDSRKTMDQGRPA
jgi:signal transduction histidine kinase/large-conductance mechanosensitive channel